MKLDFTAPDHSVPSRRRRQLRITLPVKDWFKSRHLVVDSIGDNVYGEGERFTTVLREPVGEIPIGLLSLSLSREIPLNSAG
jgi:Transposase DDE domain